MQAIHLQLGEESNRTVLCLGAHSDDLEIGAGATVLGLRERFSHCSVVWVVFGASGTRADEARASAEYCTRGFGGVHIEVHGFRDGFFPTLAGDIKEVFESLKHAWQPDLIFTHHRGDLHQDHRTISDLTWQTFRDHLILEYEIPKYDGDLGSPNLLNPVSRHLADEKLMVLDRFFVSQKTKSWFTRETFSAVMRLRGVESNAESGFAEAFYCRKAVFEVA